LGQLVTVILLWLLSPWRPGLVFKWSAIKKLSHYSFNNLACNLVSQIAYKFDIILLGRLFPVGLLGLYSKARSTSEIPVKFIAEVSSRSFFPILSKLQDDKNQFKSIYLKLVNFIALISLPTCVFLILGAREFIGLVFGNKWLGMVYYFQLFCLVGGIYVMNLLKVKSISALGRPDLNLKLYLFTSPLRLSMLLIVALTFTSIDPAIYIWIYFFFTLLSYIFLTGFLKKLICLEYLDEFRVIYKELLVSVGIGLLCHALLLAFPLNDLAQLSIKGILFFGLYFYLAYLLDFSSWRLSIDILKRRQLRYSH